MTSEPGRFVSVKYGVRRSFIRRFAEFFGCDGSSEGGFGEVVQVKPASDGVGNDRMHHNVMFLAQDVDPHCGIFVVLFSGKLRVVVVSHDGGCLLRWCTAEFACWRFASKLRNPESLPAPPVGCSARFGVLPPLDQLPGPISGRQHQRDMRRLGVDDDRQERALQTPSRRGQMLPDDEDG